jgi:hypothetical protein
MEFSALLSDTQHSSWKSPSVPLRARRKLFHVSARKPSPALTDAEAGVMAVLWQRQTVTLADVVAALRKTAR